MARRNMPKKVRVFLYTQLLEKGELEICSHCQKSCDELGIKQFDKNTGTGGLEIHETDYSLPLISLSNKRFMCHSCNHLKQFSFNEITKYQNELSASHKSNLIKHPIFLEWFSNYLQENNYRVRKKEVIRSGAYISGANVVTVARWLEPIVSAESPLTDSGWFDGEQFITLRGREFNKEESKPLNMEIGEFLQQFK